MVCEICGTEINLEEHHIDYIEDKKILLCKKHHEEVHHTNKWTSLKPINKSNYPKLINVEDKTHKRLSEFGTKSETFNQVIIRLLDEAERQRILDGSH